MNPPPPLEWTDQELAAVCEVVRDVRQFPDEALEVE